MSIRPDELIEINVVEHGPAIDPHSRGTDLDLRTLGNCEIGGGQYFCRSNSHAFDDCHGLNHRDGQGSHALRRQIHYVARQRRRCLREKYGEPVVLKRFKQIADLLPTIDNTEVIVSVSRLCRVYANRRPDAAASSAGSSPRGKRCPYTSKVITMDECPSRTCTSFGGSSRPSGLRLMHQEAKTCRSECGPYFGCPCLSTITLPSPLPVLGHAMRWRDFRPGRSL
jgi:hypothetical protein